MKTWMTITIVYAALLVGNYSAVACSVDTDCSPGSGCIKGSGAMYGVCAGGISPGNNNDLKPVYDPLDPNKTVGNTCSFDADCGIGSKCLKSTGSMRGTCFR